MNTQFKAGEIIRLASKVKRISEDFLIQIAPKSQVSPDDTFFEKLKENFKNNAGFISSSIENYFKGVAHKRNAFFSKTSKFEDRSDYLFFALDIPQICSSKKQTFTYYSKYNSNSKLSKTIDFEPVVVYYNYAIESISEVYDFEYKSTSSGQVAHEKYFEAIACLQKTVDLVQEIASNKNPETFPCLKLSTLKFLILFAQFKISILDFLRDIEEKSSNTLNSAKKCLAYCLEIIKEYKSSRIVYDSIDKIQSLISYMKLYITLSYIDLWKENDDDMKLLGAYKFLLFESNIEIKDRELLSRLNYHFTFTSRKTEMLSLKPQNFDLNFSTSDFEQFEIPEWIESKFSEPTEPFRELLTGEAFEKFMHLKQVITLQQMELMRKIEKEYAKGKLQVNNNQKYTFTMGPCRMDQCKELFFQIKSKNGFNKNLYTALDEFSEKAHNLNAQIKKNDSNKQKLKSFINEIVRERSATLNGKNMNTLRANCEYIISKVSNDDTWETFKEKYLADDGKNIPKDSLDKMIMILEKFNKIIQSKDISFKGLCAKVYKLFVTNSDADDVVSEATTSYFQALQSNEENLSEEFKRSSDILESWVEIRKKKTDSLKFTVSCPSFNWNNRLKDFYHCIERYDSLSEKFSKIEEKVNKTHIGAAVSSTVESSIKFDTSKQIPVKIKSYEDSEVYREDDESFGETNSDEDIAPVPEFKNESNLSLDHVNPPAAFNSQTPQQSYKQGFSTDNSENAINDLNVKMQNTNIDSRNRDFEPSLNAQVYPMPEIMGQQYQNEPTNPSNKELGSTQNYGFQPEIQEYPENKPHSASGGYNMGLTAIPDFQKQQTRFDKTIGINYNNPNQQSIDSQRRDPMPSGYHSTKIASQSNIESEQNPNYYASNSQSNVPISRSNFHSGNVVDNSYQPYSQFAPNSKPTDEINYNQYHQQPQHSSSPFQRTHQGGSRSDYQQNYFDQTNSQSQNQNSNFLQMPNELNRQENINLPLNKSISGEDLNSSGSRRSNQGEKNASNDYKRNQYGNYAPNMVQRGTSDNPRYDAQPASMNAPYVQYQKLPGNSSEMVQNMQTGQQGYNQFAESNYRQNTPSLLQEPTNTPQGYNYSDSNSGHYSQPNHPSKPINTPQGIQQTYARIPQQSGPSHQTPSQSNYPSKPINSTPQDVQQAYSRIPQQSVSSNQTPSQPNHPSKPINSTPQDIQQAYSRIPQQSGSSNQTPMQGYNNYSGYNDRIKEYNNFTTQSSGPYGQQNFPQQARSDHQNMQGYNYDRVSNSEYPSHLQQPMAPQKTYQPGINNSSGPSSGYPDQQYQQPYTGNAPNFQSVEPNRLQSKNDMQYGSNTQSSNQQAQPLNSYSAYNPSTYPYGNSNFNPRR